MVLDLLSDKASESWIGAWWGGSGLTLPHCHPATEKGTPATGRGKREKGKSHNTEFHADLTTP